jgi:hypothetical protein
VNPRTQRNYRDLAARLRQRGIPLVAVQYPLRDLGSLEAVLAGRDGVVLVDNEEVFRDALRRAPYDDIFVDQFAGDFGHLSREGNRLLAENVAQKIMSEVLPRRSDDEPSERR